MSQSRFGGAIAIALAMIAEVVICLFVLAVSIALLKKSAVWPGTLATTIIIAIQVLCILAIWASLYYGILRHRTPRRPVLSLVMLLIIPVVGGGLSYVLYQHDVALGQTSAQRAARQAEETALADLATTVQQLATASDRGFSVDLHTKLLGEPGKIEHAAKALLIAVPEARHHYEDVRAGLDIPAAMKPEALVEEGGLDQATQALIAVRAAIVARETTIDTAFAAARKVLADAAIDDAKKRAALADFDRQVAADKAQRKARAEIEAALYNDMMAVVGELKDARGRWWVHRNTLMIDDESVRERIMDRWQSVDRAEKRLRDDRAH